MLIEITYLKIHETNIIILSLLVFPFQQSNAFGFKFTIFKSQGISATGGNISYVDSTGYNPRTTVPYPGGYTIHTFNTSGNFTIISGSEGKNVEYLVIAGGGSGGLLGGGGSGGLRMGLVTL